MKFSHLLLAAALCTASAASAQTSPSAPTNPNKAASPSATPSGLPASTNNPDGPVGAGEAYTKGAPANTRMGDKQGMKDKRAMRKGDKMKSSDGKMKDKM